MTWILRADDVGKCYERDIWALRHLTARFDQGSMVALIGANGAGKSTFINLLTGLIAPTEGQVHTTAASGRQIGWCSQQQVIDWYLSVEDNVRLGARLAGLDRRESATAIDAVLDLVRLSDLRKRPVDGISGGQQQRVQIARALVHNPSMLLLDEPTTGLDADSSELLIDHLAERARNGAFVLVSSHDLSLVESRCDTVLLLAKGELVAMESRQTFLERFAGEEVLAITYEGSLDPGTIAQLGHQVLRMELGNPLQLTISRGMSIGVLTSILGDQVRIIDLGRRTPGLREAYISIMGRELTDRTMDPLSNPSEGPQDDTDCF